MVHSDRTWQVVLFTNVPGVTPRLVQVIAPAGHHLAVVVTSAGPRRRRTAGYLQVAQEIPYECELMVSNNPERWAGLLAQYEPDLLITNGFGWRLPPSLLALPRLGAINIHPSLLPRYRGPHPISWALRNGDSEIGVTIHRMDADFDTGRILAQARFIVGSDDNVQTIAPHLARLELELLPKVFTQLAQGNPGREQPHVTASYAGAFEPGWRYIDWDRPANDIHNQVRSWLGRGAIAEIEGRRVTVLKTQLCPEGPNASLPGTLIRRDGEVVEIQCGDYPLRILEFSESVVLG